MGRYICAIFIVALPILVFLYNGWIMSLAYDYTNLKKLAKEITSSTFILIFANFSTSFFKLDFESENF